MNHSINRRDGVATVALGGRFTFSDSAAFLTVVAALRGEPDTRWVVDLTALEFIDSAGMGMLLMARDAAPKLTLRGAVGQVRRTLDMARFGEVFTIVA